MGYYTQHTLTVTPSEHYTVAEIAKAIKEEEDNIFYGVERVGNDLLTDESHYEFTLYPRDEVKWYDEETDMIEFSKRFPEAIFQVYGEGEEQEDVWRQEYMNGYMRDQHIIVTWSDWSVVNPEDKNNPWMKN